MLSFIPEDTREKAYEGEITLKDALVPVELYPMEIFYACENNRYLP
jgi:hypothetical protein